MREELKKLPQKIGALSGAAAFFLVLFVSLSYSTDLFDVLRYAVYSFFILLILGWIVGTAIVYHLQKQGQEAGNPESDSGRENTADDASLENT